MNSHQSLTLTGIVFVAILSMTGASTAQEPEAPRGRSWEKGEAERLEVWESLSPEQREKLKQALRDVWTDPAVISAREEVKQASDTYQAAIKAAVSRVDPSVADVMAKIQRSNSGMAHEHISGRPPMGMGQKKGFDDQIKPPGFLDALPPEAREKFRRAEEAAMASDAVKAAKVELEKIREEDESLRRKRLEAHRKLRKVMIDEMVRIDPSIGEIRKKLSGEDRSGQPAPSSRKDGDTAKDPAGKSEKGEKKSPDSVGEDTKPK